MFTESNGVVHRGVRIRWDRPGAAGHGARAAAELGAAAKSAQVPLQSGWPTRWRGRPRVGADPRRHHGHKPGWYRCRSTPILAPRPTHALEARPGSHESPLFAASFAAQGRHTRKKAWPGHQSQTAYRSWGPARAGRAYVFADRAPARERVSRARAGLDDGECDEPRCGGACRAVAGAALGRHRRTPTGKTSAARLPAGQGFEGGAQTGDGETVEAGSGNSADQRSEPGIGGRVCHAPAGPRTTRCYAPERRGAPFGRWFDAPSSSAPASGGESNQATIRMAMGRHRVRKPGCAAFGRCSSARRRGLGAARDWNVTTSTPQFREVATGLRFPEGRWRCRTARSHRRDRSGATSTGSHRWQGPRRVTASLRRWAARRAMGPAAKIKFSSPQRR